MELRKNPAIDLERKRGMFLSIGLVTGLSLTLMAFQWKTAVYKVSVLDEEEELGPVYEILPPVTVHEPIPRPPKPAAVKKKIAINPVFVDKAMDELEEEKIEVIDQSEIDLELGDMMDGPALKEEEPDIYFSGTIEKNPEPQGGLGAFYRYISKKMKYPRVAKRMDIQGRVSVQFVVDTDGSLTNIEVLKGIGGGCDEEAIRVIKSAPKWNPGKQRGRPVRVRMVVPIFFKLN